MGFSLLTQQIPSHVNLVLPPWQDGDKTRNEEMRNGK